MSRRYTVDYYQRWNSTHVSETLTDFYLLFHCTARSQYSSRKSWDWAFWHSLFFWYSCPLKQISWWTAYTSSGPPHVKLININPLIQKTTNVRASGLTIKSKFRGSCLKLLTPATTTSSFSCYSYKKGEWAKSGIIEQNYVLSPSLPWLFSSFAPHSVSP
jgi:hypothetical protein